MRKFFLILLYFSCQACNSLFYQGDSQSWRQPESLNIKCERESIQSADGTALMTMYCPGNAAKPKAVFIQFHGNAQNMYAHYQFLSWLLPEGYALATFDYRGYGESDGESEREGIYQDARAYIRHMRSKLAKEQRIYYGQSLGGAILMRALIDEGVRKDEVYIFEGTFASYRNAARTVLARKWFLWPLQWLPYILVTDAYAPKDDLAAFTDQNVILIHGDADPVVAFTHGQNLAEKMAKPLWRIEKGKHLDTWYLDYGRLRPALLEKINTILSRLPHQ